MILPNEIKIICHTGESFNFKKDAIIKKTEKNIGIRNCVSNLDGFLNLYPIIKILIFFYI